MLSTLNYSLFFLTHSKYSFAFFSKPTSIFAFKLLLVFMKNIDNSIRSGLKYIHHGLISEWMPMSNEYSNQKKLYLLSNTKICKECQRSSPNKFCSSSRSSGSIPRFPTLLLCCHRIGFSTWLASMGWCTIPRKNKNRNPISQALRVPVIFQASRSVLTKS